jgi:hypothetical protein
MGYLTPCSPSSPSKSEVRLRLGKLATTDREVDRFHATRSASDSSSRSSSKTTIPRSVLALSSLLSSLGLLRGESLLRKAFLTLRPSVTFQRIHSEAGRQTKAGRPERAFDLSNMHWDVRAVTTPSSDTDLSLLVTFDHAKFLFNCGEGTQRSFVQSRTSMRKLEGIYMTSAHTDVTGGLPGKTCPETIARISVKNANVG